MIEPEKYSFEDLLIGMKKEFSLTIDESILDDFAELSGDFNPLHMRSEYAEKTNFKNRVCHGLLLASFFSRLIGMHIPGEKALYFSQSLNFRNPGFINDKITIRGQIIDKKLTTKIITIKTTIHNQNEKCLVDGLAKVIVRE